jgi:LAO/AO transport system kinase
MDPEAILRGDRRSLARAITLLESTRPEDQKQAEDLLEAILPHSGASVRIGISGAPGAGKSTFIETMGMRFIEQGRRVAVLAVDPSSSITGGSILGDKTRMSRLSGDSNAFVRPSPSQGSLGGVNPRTREVIWLVEAAGFDRILLETVGVGQSEVDAASMTDVYLLLQLPNAGDELQGIKKGILELADLIFVNKADLDRTWAEKTRAELKSALHLQRPHTPGWEVPVLTGSAMSGAGLTELLDSIDQFRTHQGFPLSEHRPPQTSPFAERRSEQMREWLHDRIRGRLMDRFYADRNVSQMLPALEQEVTSGRMTVLRAVEKLFDVYN